MKFRVDIKLCIVNSIEELTFHLGSRYKATLKREFKLLWRKAGLLKYLDD